MSNRRFTFDADLELKDAYLVAASAVGQVDSANKIIDLGAGRVDARAIIDVSAIEIASNDEEYDIIIQGSNSATFASGIENLGQLNLGATEVRQGGGQDSTTGRYELLFSTEQAGTIYRYVRIYTVVAGAIATGINYAAFIVKNQET